MSISDRRTPTFQWIACIMVCLLFEQAIVPALAQAAENSRRASARRLTPQRSHALRAPVAEQATAGPGDIDVASETAAEEVARGLRPGMGTTRRSAISTDRSPSRKPRTEKRASVPSPKKTGSRQQHRLQASASPPLRGVVARNLPPTSRLDARRSSPPVAGRSPAAITESLLTTLISLDETVEGTINAPQESHAYEFTAAAGLVVFLDQMFFSIPATLNWTLEDRWGRVILSDLTRMKDLGPAGLMGGQYTVTVTGEAGLSGPVDYRFRIVDAEPQSFGAMIGDTVDSAITVPGATHTHGFSAAPGERIYLDMQDNFRKWKMRDEHGRVFFDGNVTDRGPFDLMGGDYTIEIYDDLLSGQATTGTYRFRIVDVSDDETPIAIGTEVSGAISNPGDTDRYTFTAAPNQIVFIDRLTTTNTNLRWRLEDSHGRVIQADQVLNDIGPFSLVGGEYTLTVNGLRPVGFDIWALTGDYTFTIVDQGTASYTPTGDPLVLDTLVSDTITDPGGEKLYVFDASSATPLFFDAQSSNANLDWELIDFAGEAVFSESWNPNADPGPYRLADGTYTLRLDASGTATPSYDFRVWTVSDSTSPVALGAEQPGSFSGAAGATHFYTFEVASGQKIFLDSTVIGVGPQMRCAIHDPQGQAVVPLTISYCGERGPFRLAAGSYTLRLDPPNADQPDYSFQINEVLDSSGTAELSIPALGAIATPGAISSFAFEMVEDGGEVVFDLGVGDSQLDWSLMDEAGTTVFGPVATNDIVAADRGPAQLAAGDYTFVFDHGGGGTPSHSFTVRSTSAGLPVLTDPVSFTTTPSEFTYDVQLVEPVTIDQMRYVLVEGLSVKFQPGGGTVTADVVVRLLSGADEVIELPPYSILPTSSAWVDFAVRLSGEILPELTPANPTISIDALRFVISQPSTSTSTLSSVFSDGALRCHFVPCGFEPCGAHVRRTMTGLAGIVYDQLGTSDWQVVPFDAPVPTNGLVLVDGPAFTGGVVHSIFDVVGTTSEAQLMLSNGDVVTMSDWQPASSLGPPASHRLSNTHSLALKGHEFAGETIEGFRWRIHTSSSGGAPVATYTPPDPLVMNFLYESESCFEGWAVEQASLEPRDGTSMVAGSAAVLSGRIQLPSYGATPAAVLIDEQPVDSIDATGRFFKTVTIEEGANLFDITVLPADCGETPVTLEIDGATQGQSLFDSLADVSTDVSVAYGNTTYHQALERLVVDVTACNTGETSIEGSLLMVFTRFTEPSVSVATPEGFSEAGKPYVVIDDFGADGLLTPGECTAAKKVAFADPDRVRVDFDLQWLATANGPPSFVTAPPVQAQVGGQYSYLAQATDPDGHMLQYELVERPPAMTVDPVTGEVAWTPVSGDLGSHSVAIRATDGFGGVVTQSFVITVGDGSGNSAPYFTSAPDTRAATGATYTYQATAFDANGDALQFTLLSAPGTGTMDPTGLLTWDFALPGATGTYEVEIEVDDLNGGTARQLYTLTVGSPAVNPSVPRLFGTPGDTAVVDQLYVYQPVVENPDPDEIPVFSLAPGFPAGMTIDPTSGRVEWTPTIGQVDVHAVELIVSDGNATAPSTTSQSWTVQVVETATNRAPVIVSVPTLYAVVDQPYSYEVQAVDPDGDLAGYELVNPPAGMSIQGATGVLSWTPAATDIYSVAIRAIDTAGAFGAQVFDLVVEDANASPTITSTPPVENAMVGAVYQYDVLAVDPDGQQLTYELTSAPSGMAVHPQTGLISWTPNLAQIGSSSVTVRADDGLGGRDTQSFDVAVDPDLTPPSVTLRLSQAGIEIPQVGNAEVQACVDGTDDVGIVSRTLLMDAEIVALDPTNCAVLEFALPASVLLRAEAADAGGNVGSDETTLDVLDMDACVLPTVEPTSIYPEPGAKITAPEEIKATINDVNTFGTLSWEVAFARQDSDDFTVIGSGTGEVTEAVLATFDPTLLPNDVYTIRITAQDDCNQRIALFDYSVEGGLKLGNFEVSFTDLVIPLAGIPIVITRAYNSLDTSVGDFGHGWRLGLPGDAYDSAVESTTGDDFVDAMASEPFKPGTRVYVTRSDGERVGFTFEPQNIGGFGVSTFLPQFTPDDGVNDTLEAVSEGGALWFVGGAYYEFIIPYNPDTYILTTKEHVKYTIDESGGLQLIEDANGNTIDVTPGGLISSTGASVVFERDTEGRISRIIEPDDDPGDGEDPGELQYTYDGSGNLTEFRDQRASEEPLIEPTRYFYDAVHVHHLKDIEDPLGKTVVKTIFDTNGRHIGQCDAYGDPATVDGNHTTLPDPGCFELVSDAIARLQVVVNARGYRTDLFYDPRGNLVEEHRYLDIPPDVANDQITYRGYDDNDNLTSIVVGPENDPTEFLYDERGNRLRQTDPLGNEWVWTYNECDFVESECDPLGNCTYNEYDDDCNLRFVTDPLGSVTEHMYNGSGQRTDTIDAVNNHWQFQFDPVRGLPTGRTDPSGNTATVEFTSNGDLMYRIDRNGRRIDFAYDAAHNLETETWDDGRVISYTYYANGQVETVTDPDSAYTFSYYETGLPSSIDNLGTPDVPHVVVGYEYDGNGNVTKVTDSLGGASDYEYDALDRQSSIRQSGTGVNEKRVDLKYDASGALELLERFADLEGTVAVANTFFGYDCSACPSRLTQIHHRRPDDSTIHDIDLIRNQLGDVEQIMDAEGMHDYAYDAKRRLRGATHPPSGVQPDETYEYDAVGNRQSSHLSVDYEYRYEPGLTGGNQLEHDDRYDYEYDNEGNLVLRTEIETGFTTQLDYDYRNRCIAVTTSDANGISTVLYRYDAANRRIRIESASGVVLIAYDGRNPAIELDELSGVLVRRLYSRHIDEIVGDEHQGKTRWLLPDHIGSVRDIVGNDGVVLNHYTYDTFGSVLEELDDSVENRIGFAAREFGNQAGFGFFRARFYDPATGRFVQQDPRLPHQYEYANNNPFVFKDPTGRIVEYVKAVGCGLAFTGAVAGGVFAVTLFLAKRGKTALGYPPAFLAEGAILDWEWWLEFYIALDWLEEYSEERLVDAALLAAIGTGLCLGL